MIVRICSFSKKGKSIAEKMFDGWEDMIAVFREETQDLSEFVKEGFLMHQAFLFVGACGIAVRTIAPFVKDKLVDSPVVVMDEKGEFVIPILSGHMGSANELANIFADKMQATPVLTTATDVEGLFSVDVFAKKNGLRIVNRKGIQNVSQKLLEGDKITISIAPDILVNTDEIPEELMLIDYPPKKSVDVIISDVERDLEDCLLHLVPKQYVLGVGCRRGKTFEEMEAFIQKALTENMQIDSEDIWKEICAVASIDLKKKELGLAALAQFHRLPFETYPACELERVPGQFEESSFVKQTTGVANVCERAAMCSAGAGAKLVVRKVARDGITMAVAKRQMKIRYWKENVM